MARRLLYLAVFLVGGVLVLLLAAWLVLQTAWGRNYVREIAERQASGALGAHVTIGGLGGSLLYGATIDRLAITDDGVEIASATQISASYDAFDLARGTFALDEIFIDNPVIHGRALELIGREEPDDPQQPSRAFSIERIVVRNGQVLVGHEPSEVGGFEVPDVLRDLNAELSLRIEPEMTEVAVQALSFVGEAPAVTLEQLKGTVTIDRNDLVLDNISVRLAESSMTLNGRIANFRALGGNDGARAENDRGGPLTVVGSRR